MDERKEGMLRSEHTKRHARRVWEEVDVGAAAETLPAERKSEW